MGSRKDRYRWECTGCGHMIERNRSDRTSKYDAHQLLCRDAADHLQHCDSDRFVDVDDYYAVDACLHPWVRPSVRRRRKIALFRVGNNRSLHIDYGAEKPPCGYTVGRKDAVEVNVTDFYRGLMQFSFMQDVPRLPSVASSRGNGDPGSPTWSRHIELRHFPGQRITSKIALAACVRCTKGCLVFR